jgi:cytochrome P450
VIDISKVTVADLEADPYPIYEQLRDTGPVAYMPCLDVWMVTSWDTVSEAANDPQRFPAHVARSPTDRALGGVSMMTTNGEPAKERRRPFDSTLRPRAVEANMPSTFARLCDERLELIAESGHAELVADYFEPVSLLSLAHAMGISDLVDLETLRHWFAGLAAGVSNYEDDPAKTAACAAVSSDIDATLRPRFEKLLTEPNDGMLSTLIHAREGTLDERLGWAMPSLKLVLLGGLQEPAHGGATIAYCLLNDRDQWNLLSDDPTLVPAAVEEGLRWTAPIGNLLRGVAPGSILGGVHLPDGARVILVVASANRDRAVWGPTADEFDINRPKRTHLSFAAGPHYCIGHHFARVQLRIAIERLVQRFPDLRLGPGKPVLRGHEYRSPTSLRVVT